MAAIKDWIRTNADQGRALMRENLSYVFFKELTGAGPLGALNVPVTPHVSVAADPNYVPLGAPIYIARAGSAGGCWPVGRTGHRWRDQRPELFRCLLGRRPGRSRHRGRDVGQWRGVDPGAEGRRIQCARSALKKPLCGSGSLPRSGRCRANFLHFSHPSQLGKLSPASPSTFASTVKIGTTRSPRRSAREPWTEAGKSACAAARSSRIESWTFTG